MSNPYTVESLLCEAASANSLPKANRAAALAIEELSRRDRKEQLKLQRSQQETTAAREEVKEAMEREAAMAEQIKRTASLWTSSLFEVDRLEEQVAQVETDYARLYLKNERTRRDVQYNEQRALLLKEELDSATTYIRDLEQELAEMRTQRDLLAQEALANAYKDMVADSPVPEEQKKKPKKIKLRFKKPLIGKTVPIVGGPSIRKLRIKVGGRLICPK